MLALLSRFLQGVSLWRFWMEAGDGEEEELVLARESSSDIPVWIGEEPKNLHMILKSHAFNNNVDMDPNCTHENRGSLKHPPG